MEDKRKYYLELSGVTSAYFNNGPKTNKILQQTPSRFSASSLSEIFPDLKSKSSVKLERLNKNISRPTTATMTEVVQLENSYKQNTASHSEMYLDFNSYIGSLKHLKALQNELSITYLLVSSQKPTHGRYDSSIPYIQPEHLNKDTLIEITKKLTSEFRFFLKSSTQSKPLETIWRGIIKILDYTLEMYEYEVNDAKKEFQDLCERRVAEVQEQYNKMRDESSKRIRKLTVELEATKQIVNLLEQEIGVKSRIIMEKERKIDDMITVGNRTYTIYRLKRMIKGLNDFIIETEYEQESQEKTLGNISKILDITEKLRKPPSVENAQIQTNCASLMNLLRIRELSVPMISLNPLYYIQKPMDKFVTIVDQEILSFCESVLRDEVFKSYAEMFFIKSIEKGYDSAFLTEMLLKLDKLSGLGLKWPAIFQKLLGMNSNYIGNLWKYVKTLDSQLKSDKYMYFIDLDTVFSVLFKFFPNETFRIHRILFDIEILEPNETTKAFQPTPKKKIETFLMKLSHEIKKRKINLKNLLFDASQGKSAQINKTLFNSFIQSLPMYSMERTGIELWEFLLGKDQDEVLFKTLLKAADFNTHLERSKTVFVDKYDLILRAIAEWDKKQEKFLEVAKNLDKTKNLKEISISLKTHGFDLNKSCLIELYIAIHKPNQLLNDCIFENFDIIDTFKDKKRRTRSGKL